MKESVEIDRRPFEGRRITLRTRTPFDQVVARLEATFPRIDPNQIDAIVVAGDGPGLRGFLERSAPGTSFNVFFSLDQGGAMTLLGTPLKARFYLVGNALIAQRLFALEPAAGLSAPVRIVISEAADGATHIDYEEPTSVFGQFATLRESPVPRLLDEKLREALTAIAT
ncbi:MAG TPA: DUF302 domain-containing protein [Polyangiaceae bacterium]